ncbi:MAG: Ig-like domain-containing protein [Anaerolineales bacterium]
MFKIDFKRYFRPFFKYSSTLLLVACLAFAGLPAAHASGIVQSPSNAPLLVPGADATLSIHPLERVMIGEDFEFYATFDNSAETGYGPFIDLIFPSNGADGAAGTDTPDGINFVSAKYESYTLHAISLTFPAPDPITGATCVNHPLAVDASGNAVQVCGTTGDTLVVLELPFSSIAQAMPALGIAITAHVSNLADVDTPLTILGRGGYRNGADNLNNPVDDPAILNPPSTNGAGWPSLQVTPRVIYIEKSFNGPKECPYNLPDEPVLNEADCYGEVNPVYESVSGPNFPRQYDINIYVAAGQTVTDLDVTDYFPNNLAYLGVTSLGGGTLVDSPTVGAAANPPDNDLIVNFASLTGSTDITVDFFIPELDANGNPVLDPATGNAAVAENIASALGDWTPVDTRDPGGPDNAIANGPCPGSCVPLHTLNIRSIAVQKSVAIETDNGAPGYSPGDLLKYTLDFQVSDYFTFGDLALTDVMTDGQILDTTTAPAFTVSDWNNPTPLTGSFVTGNDLIITDPSAPTGDTTLAFNISTAMTNAGAADGILQGGEAGTTGAIPATGQIVFYAKIQEDFSYNYPSGDPSVDHGDVLFNSVMIEGTIYDEALVTPTLNAQNDDSVQKLKIVYGCLAQTVYAVNGSTTFTAPAEVQPGDTITFRLTQSLPSSDSDKLTVTDYLPLPLFAAAEVATFDNVTDGTPPAAGHAQYDATSTLNTGLLAAPTPTLSADATANSLSFDFGSFDDPSDTTSEVDILYTVTISNAPYADGSLLTNLALGFENTTNDGLNIYTAPAQFKLKEPGISLRKGVVASDNAAAVFIPNPPGPVAFNAPGSNPSWSGVIASGDNNPTTGLINSDVQNVNSGDLVTFAVVLENLGSSSLGSFDVSVKDTIPANLQIPAGGINLQAWRGDGAAVTFTPVGSTATDPSGLFDDGIIFDDESATQGVTHVYDPASGQNLIVITYDLQIAADLPAATVIVNTATLLSYAGTDGGPNHVGVAPTNNVYTDDATVTLPDAGPVIKEGASVSVTTPENSPTPFSLKLHATDANGDPLTWSILSPAVYGTANVGASTGVVTYAPFLNYHGPDTFVVQVSDGKLTDTINVNVTVKSVLDKSELIWNQSYRIQYDTWVGSEDINAMAFASGYRKATSGAFTFKPNQKFTGFKWITYRGPDQGKAQVLVDGVVKATVDLYNPAAQWQYPVEIKGLTSAKHTVVVKAMNARNAASSGNWVVVDGFTVGLTTYDDDTINVPYSDLFSYGSWAGKVQLSGPRFGAYRISSVKDASMKFSFTGMGFNWVTARGPLYGKAAIYVDGILKKTVDLYSARQQWQYRVKIDLGYGTHTVEIRVLHIKNPLSKDFGVVADGFEIN